LLKWSRSWYLLPVTSSVAVWPTRLAILASLVVIISAAASYYMTFMNVVIGYGIIASVMTTDIDLSKEVVGWLYRLAGCRQRLAAAAYLEQPLPLYAAAPAAHAGTADPKRRVVLLAGLMVWGPIRLLETQQKRVERTTGVDMPSYGGVVANSYLPSNWLSALGLYAWAQVDESSDNKSLINPAKNSPTSRRRDG
jgi:KDO II ethanolaminephosphotransferase